MHAKSPVTRENILLIFTSPISSDWKNFSAGTVPIGKKCDLRESSCSFRATGACGARSISGGVAERLIAPVLKTGRPKGLVSSNLTPSASLISDSRLGIVDWEKKPCRKQSAEKSKNRSADHVGQIMCAEVYPRETDQDGNRQTREADTSICEK